MDKSCPKSWNLAFHVRIRVLSKNYQTQYFSSCLKSYSTCKGCIKDLQKVWLHPGWTNFSTYVTHDLAKYTVCTTNFIVNKKVRSPPQKNNLKWPNPAAQPREAIPLPERHQPAGTQTPTPERQARLPLSSSPGNSSSIYWILFFHLGSNNNKKGEI